ncbi:MAG: multidrug effflux MFS transporter [Prevotella sp.]|jgi:DHA1 family bicyclomycin/chloramphenicol resistance-like MFS transporter
MKKIGFFIPVTLGMLTAFGPFVTDFYLPAMPEMATYFKTSPSMVSMSLTAGMIGLALGQILIGPLSDKYGRKRPLVFSMVLFILASLFCLFAPNIYIFNLMRVFQGLGGAGGIVLSKSISTDMFTGRDLTNFMAILGAINGVAPVTAPIVGGAMTTFTTWQGIFILLLVLGVILLVCSCRLRETLPPGNRSLEGMKTVYSKLFRVFANSRFTLSSLSMMFAFFTFFSYIASSPFIFQTIYGLSPFAFSLCFGMNAFMIGVGAALATRFHHANTALKWASIDMMISAVLVAACQLAHAPLAVIIPCYTYLMISFGLLQPVSTSIALDSERENAGAASAVFGALGFVAGAIASPLASMGQILVSTSILIVVGALCCLLFTLPLCQRVKQEAVQRK